MTRKVLIVTGGGRGIGASVARRAGAADYAVCVNYRQDEASATAPLQRGGRVEEVADAILWLLSEQASYTTGALLDVSGGR